MIRQFAFKTIAATMTIASFALISACQNDSTLAAPDVDPRFASASSGTEVNERTPYDITVTVPCANNGAGELVALSGTLHTIINIRSDNNGGFGLKVHSQTQGVSGVGLITGRKYQLSGVSQSNQNIKAGETFTMVNNFRLVGQGPGNNLMIHENTHYTINAKGELTSTHENVKIDCK